MPRSSLRLASLIAVSALACSDGDSPPPTTLAPDVIGGGCVDFCDDRDPCTDDFCQSDGSCLHVARDAFGACQTAAHCDDGDPCSVDSCAIDFCGNLRCEHVWDQAECRPCGELFGPCDDGNPCTVDTCGDDQKCDFSAPDLHCDAACNQGVAQSADVAEWGWYGYQSYFVGVAAPAAGTNCDADLCACESQLQLRETSFGFELRDATGLDDPEWLCEIQACEPRSVACSPLLEGVGYVTWGVMSYLNAFAGVPAQADTQADTFMPDAGASDTAAPPRQPIDAFLVEGYCLSTRLEHLPGAYDATFESGGRQSSFGVEIAYVQGIVHAMMSACIDCAATGLVPDQVVALGSETGTVTFPLALTDAAGLARLYARRDHFIGDLRSASGGFLGTVTLERRARQ